MDCERLLDALSDPTHPEHDEMCEWAPPGFDRTAFDVNEATCSMRSARLRAGWCR